MKCDICRNEFTEYPNNAHPFEGKYCCRDCDDRFVTPARMLKLDVTHDEHLLRLLQFIAMTGKNLVKARETINERPVPGTLS